MEATVETISKRQAKKILKKQKLEEKKRLHKETRIRKRQPSHIRKKKKHNVISNFKIVLDFEFQNLMTEKEMMSTIAQIQYSYAENRNFDLGLDLYCTSMSENSESLLKTRCKDYSNWKMFFSRDHFLDITYPNQSIVATDKSITHETKDSIKVALSKDQSPEPAEIRREKMGKSVFCYLTADSPNEITDLDKDTIYVIGAIVDHNRYKNLCYEKAEELGIRHARLPISSYIAMSTRKVLTINHVVEILANYVNNQDWEESFLKVIPRRKGAQKIDDDHQDKNQEENE